MRTIVVASISILSFAFFFFKCSVLKKEDPEKDIRAFVAEFEKSLAGAEDDVLKQFSTKQSKQAVVAAVRLLQNKQSDFIRIETSFAKALIYREQDGIRVIVPADITVQNVPDHDDSKSTSFAFILARREQGFVVTKIEAEALYDEFQQIKMNIAWDVQKLTALADRKQFYKQASELGEKYDSAVWYAHYAGITYYYVVNGNWHNYFVESREEIERPLNCKMGLVNDKGEQIVPADYDLIGTPGIIADNLVEVKRHDAVGWYTLQGLELIPVEYTWIVPYPYGRAKALAKKDTAMGWFDDNYIFHAGYPDEAAKNYAERFRFLPEKLIVNDSTVSLCEIPDAEYAGYGIFLPPAYLVRTGLMNEIEPSFQIGNLYYRANIVSSEATSSFVEDVFDKFDALVTTFTEKYVEGRQEFYRTKTIELVDDNQQVLLSQRIGDGDAQYRLVDSTVLEIKVTYHPDSYTDYFGDENGQEWNTPSYYYYRFSGGEFFQPVKLTSAYPETLMARLDSSYLTGDFMAFDNEDGKEVRLQFLSMYTIRSMRNEILARHGYTFTEMRDLNQFSYRDDYKPLYRSYADFRENMTEVELHNLQFLERIVGTLDPDQSI